MTYIIHRDDELYHFGVKGQKWGIRRYQNEDGSYKNGAEGRYDPDGKPGPNTGRNLKNMAKSAAGIYEEGDGNPYVSERRRKNRKAEYDTYEKASEAEKKAKEKKKTPGDLEDEEISKRADAYQKKNKNMSRRDAEDAAEWDMINENRAKRNQAKEAKKQAKEAEKQAKKAEKQRKNDEKASKDSYKKTIGRFLLRTAAGNIASNAAYKLSGENLGIGTAVGTAANIYNIAKSASEAKRIYDYRKRNSARHSDLDQYDALYHSETGMTYGIVYS